MASNRQSRQDAYLEPEPFVTTHESGIRGALRNVICENGLQPDDMLTNVATNGGMRGLSRVLEGKAR